MKRFALIVSALFCFFVSGALANKTSVEVKAPAEIKVGTEVTITINVMHSGNSKGHHTDWVLLKINGKEVQRWSYTKEELPPDAVFTVEYKITATEDMNIEAQGNCNIHGSRGPQNTIIKTAR